MTSESAAQGKGKRLALTVFSLAIALSFLGFAGWVTWKTLVLLSSQVAATVIVGIITASASLVAVIKAKQAEHRCDIENELRKQKAPIYEEFSSFLFKILMSTTNPFQKEKCLSSL